MKLGTLMEGVAVSLVRGTPELEVSSIAYDSRKVKPGGLFVAIKGRQFDGHQFIPQALSRGAKAIVVETQTLNIPSNFDVAILRTFDSRQALAQLAARFWGNPSAGLILIGITGTNGKTTTAYLVE
ncbi:UDP-N-acetylmuramoyl-L-alanyl-D-glutamate--2,6-diaminopimelate ligase, partial [candidate division KSB1 bacterium]